MSVAKGWVPMETGSQPGEVVWEGRLKPKPKKRSWRKRIVRPKFIRRIER